MIKYQYTPSNDKPQKIVIFIDYLRDRMKLTIMGEIIEGSAGEGDTITQVIKDLCFHTRYQYDEQTRLGYVQHKFHYNGQTDPKRIYSKINHYWE